MALQIAKPAVVAKVERLAKAAGMTKTAVVEKAVDLLAAEAGAKDDWNRIRAILEQLHRIPDRPDAYDPLEWDEHGLPK